jgi:hypothetical protein
VRDIDEEVGYVVELVTDLSVLKCLASVCSASVLLYASEMLMLLPRARGARCRGGTSRPGPLFFGSLLLISLLASSSISRTGQYLKDTPTSRHFHSRDPNTYSSDTRYQSEHSNSETIVKSVYPLHESHGSEKPHSHNLKPFD